MSGRAKAAVAALMAAMALGAVGAPGASAVTHEFRAEGGNATLTGVQEANHRLTFTEHNDFLECDKAHFEGVQGPELAATLRLHPTYTGNCHTASFNAIVTTTGCDYLFGGQTDESGHAPVSIDCDHEDAILIDIESGLCTLEISDTHGANDVNQGLRGVNYETVTDGAGNEAITIDATISNITYRTTGAFCPFAGYADGGTTEDGFYGGDIVLADKAGSKHVTVE